MTWGDGELLLIALAAMLSPTTLSFSVLALVLGDRPLRTGIWFYLGAVSVMLLVARDWTVRILNLARDWLLLHARTVAAVLVVLLAAVLLRNGIAGLT